MVGNYSERKVRSTGQKIIKYSKTNQVSDNVPKKKNNIIKIKIKKETATTAVTRRSEML